TLHTAAVEDARELCDAPRTPPEAAADGVVNLLGLLGSSNSTRADGPHRLVGDHDFTRRLLELAEHGVDLTVDDIEGFVAFAFFESLADANDRRQTCRQRCGGL